MAGFEQAVSLELGSHHFSQRLDVKTVREFDVFAFL
jgi:hypothetical protein